MEATQYHELSVQSVQHSLCISASKNGPTRPLGLDATGFYPALQQVILGSLPKMHRELRLQTWQDRRRRSGRFKQ